MTRQVPLTADDAAVIGASFSEPDRFASLFDRHAPHIHRYLARRVGRQAADDLVAETFLVAFGKRGTYNPGFRDARPWLYGIATNLVAQHRREESRQFRLSRPAGPDQVQSDYSERTVVNLTARSIRSALVGAIAGLAEPDRDVLLLIAWEQLSYEEVARALGIPVGTVRSRLHRARTKVRQALAGTPAAATYEEILNNE
jgi:RNA polymerase sigma-70 factor (ECF subfamily)